jgi:hypothetical protein
LKARELGPSKKLPLLKFELKLAIVRSPGLSFLSLQGAAQIPLGKIKFDARNFQKSVEKFQMLQNYQISSEFRAKKTP